MNKKRCRLYGSIRTWISSLILMASVSAFAAIDPYEFSREDYRVRFKTLTEELRCPKCQNNNLADSNAPIAADMRREIHRMLEEGSADQGIVDYMVDRYGDFVRYRPKQDASTAFLWYGPFGLLLAGVAVVLVVARRGKVVNERPNEYLTDPDTDQQRLKRLLAGDHQSATSGSVIEVESSENKEPGPCRE